MRSRCINGIFDGTFEMDRNKMMLDITRLLPTVCTAVKAEDDSIHINGKIMGVGFVLKLQYLRKVADIFKNFMKEAGIDAESALKAGGYDRFGSARGMPKEWQIKALELLSSMYISTTKKQKKGSISRNWEPLKWAQNLPANQPTCTNTSRKTKKG